MNNLFKICVLPFGIYAQICDNVKNDGWSVIKDPERYMESYASKQDQWVSYNDMSDIARKVCVRKIIIIFTSYVPNYRDT